MSKKNRDRSRRQKRYPNSQTGPTQGAKQPGSPLSTISVLFHPRSILKLLLSSTRVKLLLLLSLSSLAFLFFLRWDRGETFMVAGNVSYSGDVAIRFHGLQEEGVSPACGCVHPIFGHWRGISFIGREIDVARTGVIPETGYLITSPEPGQIDWRPSYLGFTATIYSFSAPYGTPIDFPHLLSADTASKFKQLHSTQVKGFEMALISNNPLHIRMEGHTPLAAWLPAEKSTIKLGFRPARPGSLSFASIQESYVPYTDGIGFRSDSSAFFMGPMGVPSIDLLGPDVVLWTDDPKATVILSESFPADSFHILEKATDGERRIIVIALNPAFAIRVAVSPYDREWRQRDPRAARLIPPDPRDSGIVTVRVSDPERYDTLYSALFDRISRDPSVYVTPLPTNLPVMGMGFAYPPIPRNAWFNVFGPMEYLRLDWAQGKVMVGAKSWDIDSSPLELRGVDRLRVQGAEQSIPIELDLRDGRANLRFQANSSLSVNGQSLKLNWLERHDSIATALALISAVAAILSAWFEGRTAQRS